MTGRAQQGASSGRTALGVLCCVVIDLLVLFIWTAWWHIGSGYNGPYSALLDALVFWSWTLLPCWVLAVLIVLLTRPLTHRVTQCDRAYIQAGITLLAPLVWAFAYCLYYQDLPYFPVGGGVACAAWVLTLQPLWAFLLFRHWRRWRQL